MPLYISWKQSPATFRPWYAQVHMEAAFDEQLEANLNRMDERFDQFDALVDQLATFVIANGHCRQLNPRFKEDDKESVEKVLINPFVGHGARREHPLVPNNSSRQEAEFKLDIVKLQGCLQPEEFLDWVAVEEILDFMEVPYDRRVSFVDTKFRGELLHGGSR